MKHQKRQKRNKPERAYTRGYQAGVHGKSREICPFGDEETKRSWLNGWRLGREDSWAGLKGTAGVAFNRLG